MKILLINSPYLDIYGPIKSAVGIYFPLGLGYIASILKQNNHKVILIDPEADKNNFNDIKNIIQKEKPDIIGISCATPTFQNAVDLAKLIKKTIKIPVVLGGVHASALPKQILENYKEFDIIIIGEGEHTFLDIANLKNLKDINGIAYREKNKIKINPPREFIQDLDSLPLPARELVNLDNYTPSVHVDIGKKSATILTSRGCPYNCTYCASYLTTGKKFRMHSPEYIVKEIEYLHNSYGIKHIIIQDDTFTVSRERTIKFCKLLLKKKLKIDWYCFARVNTVDKQLLRLMKKAGLYSIGYGVESASPKILKNIKKNITINEIEKAFKISRDLNLKTLAFFMFGNPGETKQTIKQTINFAIKLKPDLAFFNSLIPYPGTEVYNTNYSQSYNDSSWKDFVAIGINPVVKLDNLTKQDLQKYISKANIKFYLRPSQIYLLLKHIKTPQELLVYIKGSIGILKQIFAYRNN